jgi:hypothetical protein
MHLADITHTAQHVEAFDTVVRATDGYPITHLGYLKSSICTSGWTYGWMGPSFAYRAWRMWHRTYA